MRADTDHASDRGEGVNEGMGGGAGGWGPEGGGRIGGYTAPRAQSANWLGRPLAHQMLFLPIGWRQYTLLRYHTIIFGTDTVSWRTSFASGTLQLLM